MNKSYAEKLRDPRWQKKRLEVMSRAEWKCETCHSDTETLQVHHRYYTKGREPWQYPDWVYQCLCEGCHANAHGESEDSYSEEWEDIVEMWGAYMYAPFSSIRLGELTNAIIETHGVDRFQILNAFEVFLRDPEVVMQHIDKYWDEVTSWGESEEAK